MDLMSFLYVWINVLTVVFSLIGMLAIWKMVRVMQPELGLLAGFGGGLVVAGGFCVALNRFLSTFNLADPLWLPNDLFSFLLPGFMCVALAIWMGQQAVRGRMYPQPFWVMPLVMIALIQVFIVVTIDVFNVRLQIVQLTLVSLFSLGIALLCSLQAYHLRLFESSWLFLLYAVLVVLVNTALHASWPLLVLLSCNAAASVAFMVASIKLSTLTRWYVTRSRQLPL